MDKVHVRHGEIFLQMIDSEELPKGKFIQHKTFIVGHSETGHHHVLESAQEFEVMTVGDKKELYLRLFEPAKLVHNKTVNKHKTLPVIQGTYKVINKLEYSPFTKIMERVFD